MFKAKYILLNFRIGYGIHHIITRKTNEFSLNIVRNIVIVGTEILSKSRKLTLLHLAEMKKALNNNNEHVIPCGLTN